MAECEARSILTMRHCWEYTERRYWVGCIHEHLVKVWLCVEHAASFGGLCRQCLESAEDGHQCPGFATALPDEGDPPNS